MKKLLFSLLVMLFVFPLLHAQEIEAWTDGSEPSDNSTNKEYFQMTLRIPTKAKKYYEGMVFIAGGPYKKKGANLIQSFTDRDTTLLTQLDFPVQVTLSGFYICDHEVSNAEYHEFTNWVRMRAAYEILAGAYPEKYLLKDGSINEDMAVDWSDTAIAHHLFLPDDGNFFRKSQLDTRELIYNGIAVYPDTLVWSELNLWDMNTFSQSYFWDASYNDYPVVGVNWEQANAYAKWRSDRLNEQILIDENVLSKESYFVDMDSLVDSLLETNVRFKLLPGFRLPTHMEWMYAATDKKVPFSTSYKTLKEDEKLFKSKLKEYRYEPVTALFTSENSGGDLKVSVYNANYGAVWDQHDQLVKSYGEDGGQITTPLKYYQPNDNGLYDMVGNVAEWVQNKVLQPRFGSFIYGQYKLIELCALFDTAFLTIIETDITAFYKSLEPVESLEPVGYLKPPQVTDQIAFDTISNNRPIILRSFNREKIAVEPNGKSYGPHWKLRRDLAELKKQYANHVHKVYHKKDEAYLKGLLAKMKSCYEHDKEVYARMTNPRVVKGGSWADPPIYLNPKTVTIKSQNASSARIGFRLVMDYMGVLYK